jgi:hypothetical protein
MRVHRISQILPGRQLVIRFQNDDIDTLLPDKLLILDHDEYELREGYDCQIAVLDGLPVPSLAEMKAIANEMNIQEASRLLRRLRDRLLMESDHVMLADFPISDALREEWKVYRQRLRDLPESSNPVIREDGELDETSFTLPTKPDLV